MIKFFTMKNAFSIMVLGEIYDFDIESVQADGADLFQLRSERLKFTDLFDAEDFTKLLASEDFKFLIADEVRRQKKLQNRRIQFRVSLAEQTQLEKAAISQGFKNTSEYVRNKVLA